MKMTNDPESLIDAVLEEAPNCRETMLRNTLAAVRRRNTIRRVRRISSVAGCAAALTLLLWTSHAPRPVSHAPIRPAISIAITHPLPISMIVHTTAGNVPWVKTTSEAVRNVPARPASDNVRILNDEQLFALLEGRGAVLIHGEGDQPSHLFLTSN